MSKSARLSSGSALFFGALLVVACGAEGRTGSVDPEHAGSVVIALQSVPSDVDCLRISVTGSRNVERDIDVRPGESSVYTLADLPVGGVYVAGNAFDGACATLNAASVPTWVGAPVAATLSSAAVTHVDIVLERNGRAEVGVDFRDDDGGTSDGGVVVNDGSPCATTDDPDVVGDANCDGVEGDAARSVFVAIDGDDSAAGTSAAPMKTIAAALARAASTGAKSLLVSEGSYSGTVTLVNGISIYGGYSRQNTWSRANGFNTVVIGSSVSATRLVGVDGTNITSATVVSRMVIQTANAAAIGSSSYGVACRTCSGLVLRGNTIAAGDGAGGLNGNDGGKGANGNVGAAGGLGQCDQANAQGPGGPGGASTCGANGGSGGSGGAATNRGNDGAIGATGGAPVAGGQAGPGGNAGNPAGLSGSNGGAGNLGVAGSAGPAGAGGSVAANAWTSANGANGGNGTPGTGGGGGGGGGGQNGGLFAQNGAGNGGGGGGAGGCGGTFGTGGGGGGGSFGVFLVDSTGAQLVGNTITSGRGGAGGRAGTGGLGGSGGGGGAGGAQCTAEVGAGGAGGGGGVGGKGGSGGGGAGGPSFGVFRSNTTIDVTGNTLTFGQGGPGGTSNGGPTGATGATGASN